MRRSSRSRAPSAKFVEYAQFSLDQFFSVSTQLPSRHKRQPRAVQSSSKHAKQVPSKSNVKRSGFNPDQAQAKHAIPMMIRASSAVPSTPPPAVDVDDQPELVPCCVCHKLVRPASLAHCASCDALFHFGCDSSAIDTSRSRVITCPQCPMGNLTSKLSSFRRGKTTALTQGGRDLLKAVRTGRTPCQTSGRLVDPFGCHGLELVRNAVPPCDQKRLLDMVAATARDWCVASTAQTCLTWCLPVPVNNVFYFYFLGTLVCPC
eukprot:m.135996 g.135996  ORF g.135996 m.135996 type:complete len:262 (-) comp13987_c0_seq7:1119-1904(-)